jgi:hypothetical protein
MARHDEDEPYLVPAGRQKPAQLLALNLADLDLIDRDDTNGQLRVLNTTGPRRLRIAAGQKSSLISSASTGYECASSSIASSILCGNWIARNQSRG